MDADDPSWMRLLGFRCPIGGIETVIQSPSIFLSVSFLREIYIIII